MEKPFPFLLRLLGAAVLLCVAASANATDFYVSPTASASGDGSFGNPWRLQDALYQPSAVHPGDTIWLRGGTHSGTFVSYLNTGQAGAMATSIAQNATYFCRMVGNTFGPCARRPCPFR